MVKFKNYFSVLPFLLPAVTATAAVGEMGTGIPNFGIYSVAIGSAVRIWSLNEATVNFPAGCQFIVLTSQTMGVDYKYAIAALLTAKTNGKRVRLYAHSERDGGCGIDYIELQD
jgi:tetrahydromethanopterin S-methyltransferase subunit C